MPDWIRALADGTFGGRFDDPRQPAVPAARRYRCLYLATTLAGAYGETIARWRPSLRTLAAAPGSRIRGVVPRAWRAPRRLASVRVLTSLRLVDAEDPDVIQAYRSLLAPLAETLGLSDIDISTITGPHRRLTQTLAALIYQEGQPSNPAYSGIRYVSRLHRGWECWALFSDRMDAWPQRVIPLADDDPALHDAARILHLDLETDAGAVVTP